MEQLLHQESAQRNLNHQRQSRLVAELDRLEFPQRPLATVPSVQSVFFVVGVSLLQL